MKGEEFKDWTARPEWLFKVFKKPPGLLVDHFGDKLFLSEVELRELSRGKVDMSRYPMIPKKMYRVFMMNVADALGVVYRPYMVEAVTPEKVRRPRYELPKPKVWDVMEKRAKELKEKIERYKEEIKALEEFFRAVKKK